MLKPRPAGKSRRRPRPCHRPYRKNPAIAKMSKPARARIQVRNLAGFRPILLIFSPDLCPRCNLKKTLSLRWVDVRPPVPELVVSQFPACSVARGFALRGQAVWRRSSCTPRARRGHLPHFLERVAFLPANLRERRNG